MASPFISLMAAPNIRSTFPWSTIHSGLVLYYSQNSPQANHLMPGKLDLAAVSMYKLCKRITFFLNITAIALASVSDFFSSFFTFQCLISYCSICFHALSLGTFQSLNTESAWLNFSSKSTYLFNDFL
jgi:hypothetical protein